MEKILKYLDYCISSWVVTVYLFADIRQRYNKHSESQIAH